MFLETVIRKSALPCLPYDAEFGSTPPAGLPAEIDLVTSRGVSLLPSVLEGLTSRMNTGAGALFWVGTEAPDLPTGWTDQGGVKLPGSRTRSILQVRVRGD